MTRQNVLLCLVSLFVAFATPTLAGNAFLITGDSTGTVPFINAGPASGTTNATALGFQVNGTEYMRLTASGFVGIGTTAPQAVLDVTGGGAAFRGINYTTGGNVLEVGYVNGAGVVSAVTGSTRTVIPLWLWGNPTTFYASPGTSTPIMTVASGGVSIGSQGGSPTDLTVYGSGTSCNIGGGTGATNCSSDERLKRNITPISNALDKLEKIKGVTFFWKDPYKAEIEHIGVIAQDVEKVFPQAVGSIKDKTLGEAKTVDMAALVAPLIEAVKALKAENDTLRAEIKAKDAAFSARFDALEARGR